MMNVPGEAAIQNAGPTASDLAALGKQIFFDPSLSASGRLSCASCHSPGHAYGPPNGRAVQLGGPDLSLQGARAVPSLRYTLNRTPVWSKAYVSSAADRILEGNEPPAGGFGWDGRFNSLREQAAFPLLAPNEMANSSPEDVAAKLQRAPYAQEFRRLFGMQILDDPAAAYTRALSALERFELDDPSFHPYTSKYDGFLEGTAALSAQELRGLALFNDPRRGNCASCHLDAKGADGTAFLRASRHGSQALVPGFRFGIGRQIRRFAAIAQSQRRCDRRAINAPGRRRARVERCRDRCCDCISQNAHRRGCAAGLL
jgi:cytochrome c peroxidase